MAKHRYVTGALFDDNDDESDVEDGSSFRSRIPPSQPKISADCYQSITNGDQQKQLALQKKLEIEQRTLESASRSIALLCGTEDIGIHAANELAHQGEQLRNTNSKLDEIKTNLKVGQKHINGIKSVFSEFKNYFSGKLDPSSSKTNVPPKTHSTGLKDGRLYDTIDKSSQRTASLKKFKPHPSTSVHSFNVQSSAGPVTSSQNVDDVLEDNKVEMVHHITKLKELGLEFCHQINQQNELIDIIQNKVEDTDIKIVKQNKQMNKILGK